MDRFIVTMLPGGRITVPAAIRRELGLQAGDTLLWRKQNGAIILRKSEPGDRPLEVRTGSESAAVSNHRAGDHAMTGMNSRATRISTKGQVVIPKILRDLENLHVGDSLSLEYLADGIRVTKRSGWARATAGSLASPMHQIEPEELDELSERSALQEARDEWGAVN